MEQLKGEIWRQASDSVQYAEDGEDVFLDDFTLKEVRYFTSSYRYCKIKRTGVDRSERSGIR